MYEKRLRAMYSHIFTEKEFKELKLTETLAALNHSLGNSPKYKESQKKLRS